jgi:hypothetical protein
VRSCLQFGHADCWTAGCKRRTVAFVSFRCLLAVGVAVLGTFATACTDDSEDAVPLTTTSALATTTTRAPTTSTTLDFETEVKLAALELLEIRNEVLQNPDVNRVSEYIADTCICLERERQIVEGLVADGVRWTAPPVVPLGIRIDDRGPTEVAFTLVARQPQATIEGADAIEEVPAVDIAPYFVALVQQDSGWRINGLEGVSMGEDAALELVRSEGLP